MNKGVINFAFVVITAKIRKEDKGGIIKNNAEDYGRRNIVGWNIKG